MSKKNRDFMQSFAVEEDEILIKLCITDLFNLKKSLT